MYSSLARSSFPSALATAVLNREYSGNLGVHLPSSTVATCVCSYCSALARTVAVEAGVLRLQRCQRRRGVVAVPLFKPEGISVGHRLQEPRLWLAAQRVLKFSRVVQLPYSNISWLVRTACRNWRPIEWVCAAACTDK